MADQPTLTLATAGAAPVVEGRNSITEGPRSPAPLRDYVLPETASGRCTATDEISQCSRARPFSRVGTKTDLLARFPTAAGERGAADGERDPRGFALNFYTEEGHWDFVGSNTPQLRRRASLPARRAAQDPNAAEPRLPIAGEATRYGHRIANDDDIQPGKLFRLMDAAQRRRRLRNIAAAMDGAPGNIIARQLAHFRKADAAYGEGVAQELAQQGVRMAAE